MTKAETKIIDELMKSPKKDWAEINEDNIVYRHKAFNLTKNGYNVCVSFKTPIAMMTPKGEFVRLWDGYSKTSIAHLTQWCMNMHYPMVYGEAWNAMTVGKKYSADAFNRKFGEKKSV